MLPSPRISALLLALAAVLSMVGPLEAAPGAPVRFVEAREGRHTPALELTGTLEAVREATVAAEVAGVVETLEVREGERIGRGQHLARLRARPLELRLEAAKGQLAESEARTRSSALRLERMRTLQGSEVVSRQRMDDALHDHQAWEGKTAQLRSELDRLSDELERAVIRAPFDGVVVRERIQAGEWLDAGDPVAELVSVDELEARLEVPEAHFGELVVGSPVQLAIEALPGTRLSGRLRALIPKAIEPARVFPALVTVPADPRLGIGMMVRATLPSGPPRSSVLVPADAVVSDTEGHHVFVIAADASVRRVAVRLAGGGEGGSGAGGWLAVLGGVRAGDPVVVRGNEGLVPGQTVKAEPREPEATTTPETARP